MSTASLDQTRIDRSVESVALPDKRLLRYQPMVLCLLAMVFGILIDDLFDFRSLIYLLVFGTALVTWVGLFFFFRTRTTVSNEAVRYRFEFPASISLLIALLALGAMWHHGRWNWFGADDISTFVNEEDVPICVEGVIETEPRFLVPNDSSDGMNYWQGRTRTRFGFRAARIRDGASWRSVSGSVELTIQAQTFRFQGGENVRVFGRLRRIEPPTNPGQADFQKAARSQARMATLLAYFPESVQIVEDESIFRFGFLSRLRYELNEIAWRHLDPDQASFASALMLGNREQLSAERREAFLVTGTSHILSISGLHVGILASAFVLFYRFRLLSRRNALLATILFAIFYAWLVEFRPPVTRAVVLIIIYCIGKLLGREGFSANLLSLAGIIVLIINPRDVFNLGAQLSFLAVGTMSCFHEWIFWQPSTDPLDRLIASTRSLPVRLIHWFGRQARSAFLVSGLVWIVGLPLAAFHFKLISPVALLINPIVLVPLAWGLYAGLVMLILGFIDGSLADFPGAICQWNLEFVEWSILQSGNLPGGSFCSTGPTFSAVVIFYVGLFFTAVFPPTKLRFRTIAWLVVFWYLLAWWLPDRLLEWKRQKGDGRLVCTFIEVGHGSSVLLQMPDGQRILYDAGSFGSSVYGFRAISGLLWDERISTIDKLIISHADLDHYNALPELIQRFQFDEAIIGEKTSAAKVPSIQTVLRGLREQGTPIRVVHADPVGESTSGNLVHPDIRILNPPKGGTGGNDNSDSIVLLLEHQGIRIMLTGDIEAEGLEHLLAKPPIPCDVVLAPHHGSFNSDPTEFMNWSDPSVVVISGASDRIKAKSVDVFRAGGRTVFRTDEDCAVRVMIEDGELTVETWDVDRWRVQSSSARAK